MPYPLSVIPYPLSLIPYPYSLILYLLLKVHRVIKVIRVVNMITLCNKDFGAWDISTDSIILGVTDT